MCVQYFSADEFTTGEIPEIKNMQQPPIFYYLFIALGMFIFSSPEYGGWSNEQLLFPDNNNWYHVQSRAHHVHTFAFILLLRLYDEL